MGAGLPVISTLNNLLDTGDKLLQIEGILSGTLSFIFNSFGAGKTFSAVVADAKAKGFTEPDPREDLAGDQLLASLVSVDALQSLGEACDLSDILAWKHRWVWCATNPT